MSVLFKQPHFSAISIPKSDQVKRFVKRFQQQEKGYVIKQCYLIADSEKQAKLIILICFGQMMTANLLQKQLGQSMAKTLRNILSNASWQMSNPTDIFIKNSKFYCNNLRFFHRQILGKLTDQQVQKAYLQCISSSHHLRGAKMRKFNTAQKIQKIRKFDQSHYYDISHYVIVNKVSEFFYIVGAIRLSYSFDSELQEKRQGDSELQEKRQGDLKVNLQRSSLSSEQNLGSQGSQKTSKKISDQSKTFRKIKEIVKVLYLFLLLKYPDIY